MLVIDDDPLVSVVVRRAMENVPHRMQTAYDGHSAIVELESRPPDLIVLDNMLPDCQGIEVLTRIHELAPQVPVLFVTARGSGSTAIEAMKLSAFDYLPKPLDPTKLRTQITRALSLRMLLESETGFEALEGGWKHSADAETLSDALVGECQAMQTVFKAIGKVALQDVPVLIRGEHGTGKEAMAREIHRHSRRAEGPFIKVHCPGLCERRFDEELFEHPNSTSRGAIDQAKGGTLLLQEVGRLTMASQGKLLQLLREVKYQPRGVDASQILPCRVVAITTDDLESLVRNGEFRSDLYYILNSFVITLPPLRQRHGDMPLLIHHTLRKLGHIAEGFGISQTRISDDAMAVLSKHLWPGNIDELESVLKRAMVEQKGHILVADDLKRTMADEPVVANAAEHESLKFVTDWVSFTQLRFDGGTDTLYLEATEEMERKLFDRVLVHTSGNQAHAARILGITRASLRKKLRQYGMHASRLAEEP